MDGYARITDLRFGDDDVVRRDGPYYVERTGQDVELRWRIRYSALHGRGRQPFGFAPFGGQHPESMLHFLVAIQMRPTADGQWTTVRSDRVRAPAYRYTQEQNLDDAARFGSAFQADLRFVVAPVFQQGVGTSEAIETTAVAEGAATGIRKTCATHTFRRPLRISIDCPDSSALDIQLPLGGSGAGLRVWRGGTLLVDLRPDGRLELGSLTLHTPLSPTHGGTGLVALGTPLHVLRVRADGAGLEFAEATGSGGGLEHGEVMSRVFLES